MEAQYSDGDVITKVRSGDTALFEILIRRYNPYLYRIGRTYNYSHEDTEDLMQDSFVQAYFNLSGFEGRSSFKTWLTRIMLNNCYQKKHRLRSRKEVADEVALRENQTPLFHHSSNSESIMVNKELGRLIENALERIPADYRIVFTLRELNGMSVVDTTEALGISESNVKVRLNRAKKMLRQEIERSYSAEDIYEFNLRYCDRIVGRVMSAINSNVRPAAQGI
jgi:RNA polymerase sigma-70 factor (ECF subfamily)